MKRILLSLLLTTTASFAAELPPPQVPGLPPLPPAITDFRTQGAGLPLPELLRITLGGVLRKPYVLAPAVANETVLVSHDLSRIKSDDVLPVLQELLQMNGFSIKVVRGVFIVDKAAAQAQRDADNGNRELFVYQPRYRAVSSLSSYFNLFPKIQFSFSSGLQRQALSPALQQSAPASGGAMPATGGSPAPQVQMGADFSSGATTFSQPAGDVSVLVARGDPADLKQLRAFLPQIDTPVPQVIARAYVLEIRDTRRTDSGVSLAASILNDKLKLQLGSAPAAGDSIKFSSAGASVSAVIGALSGDSRVRLMSAPVLRAADGTSASAAVGTDTPTLGAVSSQNGVQTQSVSYQSAGVLLTVAPRIFEDSIRLRVSQEVSSFVQTDTGLSATPTKLRRSFVSDVVTSAGDIILLGGLSDTKTARGSNKSLWFFGTDTAEDSSSEIVVLLAIEKA